MAELVKVDQERHQEIKVALLQLKEIMAEQIKQDQLHQAELVEEELELLVNLYLQALALLQLAMVAMAYNQILLELQLSTQAAEAAVAIKLEKVSLVLAVKAAAAMVV